MHSRVCFFNSPLFFYQCFRLCVHSRMYVRGMPNDFNNWNMSLWNWTVMEGYFRKMENYDEGLWPEPPFWSNFSAPTTTCNETTTTTGSKSRLPSWRGTTGPIATMPAGPAVDAVAPLFVQSCRNSGIPVAYRGFNQPNTTDRMGAGYFEFNILNGVRNSVAEAILGGMNPHGSTIPTNLDIQLGATVRRVLFGKKTQNGTLPATGVEVAASVEGGSPQLYMLDAQRSAHSEVVLAAGAVLTPQILWNSDIGANGTVADLPGVGKEIIDQPAYPMVFELLPSVAEQAPSLYTMSMAMESYFISVDELNILQNKRRQTLWNATISGTNTTQAIQNSSSITAQKLNQTLARMWMEAPGLGTMGTSGFSAGAFLRSPYATTKAEADLQLTVFPRVTEPHVLREEINKQPNLAKYESAFDGAMLVKVSLLEPEARFRVYPAASSSSTDGQFHIPSIGLAPNATRYLTPLDVKRLAWGVEKVRSIFASRPLSQNTGAEILPGTGVTGSALHQHIHKNHIRNSNWVGTCRMGPAGNDGVVVDEQVRVHGVDKLRIVDASIFPATPNGNPHSSVVAVASRAADLIWNGRS